MPEKIKYQPHIDGLRAIAVILVVAFHAFPNAVTGGFIGVDIFFVISGFLISSILYSEFSKPGANAASVAAKFYGRRIRRIFPSLIIVLAACYAVGFVTLIPNELKRLSLHIAASAGFSLNLLLARETGYFNGDAAAMPLLHIWSLGIEEQFYLIWPLVIWIGTRRRVRLMPVVVFLAGCSFWWNEYRPSESTALPFYLPQMRFWELLTGSIVAGLYPSIRRAKSFANLLAILGVISIGAGLWLITDKMDIPNSLTLLPTLGAALIIAAGETAWINHTILSQRSLVWLGLISYPLYLWHWPLLSFSRILLGNADSLAVVFGTMAVSTVLAWITYKFIETPFRKGARGSLKVMILLAAMLLVGSGGYYSYRRNGFPSRFPSLIRELMDFSYAPPKQWERDGAFLTNRLDDEKDFRADTAEIDRHKPTIYLWGDSHANALYPGYKTCFGPEYNVIERAAASTPPLLGVEFPTRPNGRRINQYIFDSIVKDKPDVVVLAADWSAYDWEKIEITITQLKKAGIGHIVLVGPTPEWIGSLPEQLFNYSRRHHFAKIPKRMSTGLKEAPVRTDKAMAAFARRVGVEYISPCQILGNEDGFLTRVGDTADTLLVFDSEHLTVAGSEYLVSHFPKD